MPNILALSDGRFKVSATAVGTAATTLVQTTTTSVVVKVSSLRLCNGSSGLATATLQFVDNSTTFPLVVGMNVDPEQPPAVLASRSSPIYLTGTQSLRAIATNTNISAVVVYEELS